jgi:hypothetical protein
MTETNTEHHLHIWLPCCSEIVARPCLYSDIFALFLKDGNQETLSRTWINIYYKGWYKSNASCYFLRDTNYSLNEVYIHHAYTLY